ncbi:MAG: dienelactone hydrolase family protein [Gammaproteobacteria bacterium]|nr:dienelactone hydrolase family protein [Gammaproteobacteria bacterium]
MTYFDDVTELENGIRGEALVIPTANPTGFFQAVSAPDSMPVAQIAARLFVPAGQGSRPAVIVVPGSLGVAPSHLAVARLLTDRGIAACVIDPFGMRDVVSTVSNQAQYSFAASAWDVLATLRVLSSRIDIDPARIGAQGHSRGGSAVLSAACMAHLVSDSPERLRGVYAAYPWSGLQFLRPDVGSTVVRSVVGDRDEWCSPQQVQSHMHAMRLCGGRATCRIFAGAHHGLDRDTPVELIEEAAVAPGAPTVYIREDGALLHPLAREADPDLSERDVMVYAMKSGHGRRGARIGSEGDQAERFHRDMVDFWETLMLANAA